mgnify:CR=1 FL=1
MVKMKKGFWKKTGCILISASIILTGWTFFGSTVSEAEYDSGNYFTDGGTITSETLAEYQSELSFVSSAGDLTVATSGLAGYSNLGTVLVNGNLSLGEYAFSGDTALTSVVCDTMSGASASSFSGCSSINISISSGTSGGYHTDGVGALYNGTTLIYVPASVGESYTVVSGTTAIAAGAFNDSQVTSLYFENGDADKIGSFGTQSGWPSDEMVCYCYGGSTEESASAVATFFTTTCENAGANKVQYDSGTSGGDSDTSGDGSGDDGSGGDSSGDDSSGGDSSGGDTTTTYTVTVTEEFYDASGNKTATENSSLSDTYASGASITAKSYSGYTLTSGNSPYTVTGDASIIFAYKVSSSGGGSVTPPKKYTVTVYDEFYKSDLNTMIKRTTRSTNTYTEGSAYSFSPVTYAGYAHWGGRNESGTVTGNINVYFFYKETGKGSGAAGTTKSDINSSLPNKYQVTEGANQTVAQTNGPVKIVCNGELEKLTGIFVDGVRIDGSRYTLESGSTILTFTAGFIKLFSPGSHVIRFEYVDGYAETNLNVTESKTTTTVTYKVSSDGSISSGHTKDATPTTADGFDSKYLLCLAIFLMGAGAILFSKQKKLEALLADEREEY